MAKAAADRGIGRHSVEKNQGKYLTFSLDGEEYGLEISKVREILGMMPITSLPRTPDFVKGVINLRGKVIPVIDLRLRFGLTEKEYTDTTCIIVVKDIGETAKVRMGIIVDSVSEVLTVTADDLEPTPVFGVSVNTGFILGMVKSRGSVKMLLDIDKVLTSTGISTVLTKTA